MRQRRTFSPQFKAQVVLEVFSGEGTNAEVCREYQLKPEILAKWKTRFIQNAAKLFETPSSSNPDQARIAELERVVGRLTLQLEIAKKASNFLHALQNGGGQ
jgi:transposase-like protein